MRYYELIERSNLGPTPFVADCCDLKGHNPDIFIHGTPVVTWPPGIKFTSSNKGNDGNITEFIVNNAMVPLVTSRFLEFLSTMRVPNYQALRVDLLYSTGHRTGAFIVNFTTLIKGFDEVNSKYDVYPQDWDTPELRGTIWMVEKPVLIKNIVADWDIFRCSKYSSSIFASEEFVNLFKQHKMRGVSFREVEVT